MRIKIDKTCRYADSAGPHMPQISFVEGSEVDVSNALAESLLANGHAHKVSGDEREDKVITVESKEESNPEPESKESGEPEESNPEPGKTGKPSKKDKRSGKGKK